MKYSKGKWGERELFESPISVKDENDFKWLSNTISIHDESGRIICDVNYQSESKGWGHNNTIELYKGNAKLIRASKEMFEAFKQIISLQNIMDKESIISLVKEQIRQIEA